MKNSPRLRFPEFIKATCFQTTPSLRTPLQRKGMTRLQTLLKKDRNNEATKVSKKEGIMKKFPFFERVADEV
jgi:hypothetical protein